MSALENNTIYLIKYFEQQLKINRKDSLVIIGITDNGEDYMRIIINNKILYENTVYFMSKRGVGPFEYLIYIIEENKFKLNFFENRVFFDYFINTRPRQLHNLLLIKKDDKEKFIIGNEESCKLLHQFNETYRTNIGDSRTIDLRNKSLNDSGIQSLFNIRLRLYNLILINNDISNISSLNPKNLKNLRILDLSDNKIKDLSPLSNMKFKNLRILNLNSNKLSNTDSLKNINIKSLEQLYLSNNNISNIKFLEEINLENLEKLNLSQNKITDISPLENTEFDKLKELDLDNNAIKDISIL